MHLTPALLHWGPHPAEDLLQPYLYWKKVRCCFLSHLKLKIKNGKNKPNKTLCLNGTCTAPVVVEALSLHFGWIQPLCALLGLAAACCIHTASGLVLQLLISSLAY